jgi:hypothetical protein
VGKRVILHIGAMKSGTSFLQSSLAQNQQALADAGVSFLGGSFGKQSRAVREVLQPPGHEVRARKKSRWLALVDEASSEDRQTSIVSMEFLSFAGDEAVGRFLEPLAGFDVCVVVTVRDQFRAIPAQWQTYTRNQGLDDWPTYLRNIQANLSGRRQTRALRTFRRAQELPPVLGRWRDRSEVDELAVVTVPPPGAPKDELWRRFCTATGIPPEAADLSSVRDNPSLGYASCDYLRRLNHHVSKVPPRQYRRAVRPLARESLVHLREEEGRPPMDAGAAAFALERNAALREAVTARADRIVGTLDDLPLTDAGDRPRQVDPPPHDQVVRAAEVAWDHSAAKVEEPPGERPGELDRLVAEGARLMRLANGWGR